MPHPWFQMLQDEEAPAAEAPAAEAPAPAPAAGAGEAAGGDVVFPDDYPNSVKHFLMLGAVGMLIGAVVFLSLNMLRSKRSTVHSVTFILATAGDVVLRHVDRPRRHLQDHRHVTPCDLLGALPGAPDRYAVGVGGPLVRVQAGRGRYP